ncbi:hypothetical protein ACWC09_21865 [Streptomyces sp. NPDC001617]
MILALVALDAIFLDQGALLSPVLGKIAASQLSLNYAETKPGTWACPAGQRPRRQTTLR